MLHNPGSWFPARLHCPRTYLVRKYYDSHHTCSRLGAIFYQPPGYHTCGRLGSMVTLVALVTTLTTTPL